MAILNGTSGNDTLSGTSLADTIDGKAGNDNIIGRGGNDSILGGAGNDTLNGGTGADTMKGGAGNDLYIVDSNDKVLGETSSGGVDLVKSSVSFILGKNLEKLTLTGSANLSGTGNGLANALTGNAGNNLLNGKAGADTMKGGAGNDTYIVDNAGDKAVEGLDKGTDLVKSSVSFTLKDNVENLTLTGTANRSGKGNALANKITGNTGNNSLSGAGGKDTLNGGGGADELSGGGGNDVLVYDALDVSANGGSGTDTLRLNGAGTTLDLTSDSGPVLSSIEVVNITGSGDNTLVADEASVLALSSTGVLRVTGNAGDAVQATGAWTRISDTVAGDARYTSGGATLRVDLVVDRGGIELAPAVSALSLSALDGSNGFRIDGVDAGDYSGHSVASAGDLNGDGFDDLIVGAYHADSRAGESYVVFGRASGFASALDPGTLDGTNGFRLDGAAAADYSGGSVASAGDVNGDGFADLIVGAFYNDSGGSQAGASYVLFGKASGWGSALELSSLDGTNGFVLAGVAGDFSGYSVASAGDLNGDGLADMIVGAWGADAGGDTNAGSSYVVFGKVSGWGSALDLGALDGTSGFRLDGTDGSDRTGFSVASAGDVDGDGLADLIIGAPQNGAGKSYVVFGRASGWASALDLGALDGTNGFRLDGIDAGDESGRSVASAGDVNGDGLADLIIGARGGDPGVNYAGESYVVFGRASGWGSALDLGSLDGTTGFRLDGIDEYDRSGWSVASAGDVNGDGLDDLIVSAYTADPGGNSDAGESYMVFGRASGWGSALDLGALDGTNGFRIDGVAPDDRSGSAVAPAGDVNGDGFADLIIGAYGADSQAGAAYVLFGRDWNGAVDFFGGEGDDSQTGSAAAEVFVGGRGNDTMVGGGGADAFSGGAGDDLIRIADAGFLRVDGGSGTDTLRLVGGLALDLTALPTHKIRGIEAMSLSSGSSLTLDLQDLLNLSDTSNELRVEGSASAAVEMTSGTWTDGGVVGDYHVYTLGAATLRINTAITDVTITVDT